jgi:hypothetical protein
MSFRSLLLSAVILLLNLVSISALAFPERPPASHAVNVNEVLANVANKAELSRWVGSEPTNCVKSSDVVEVCEWQLSSSDPGWPSLRRAIDTSRGIALICALSVDGSARLGGSCNAIPQRSNRSDFSLPTLESASRRKIDELREAYRRLAQSWLDEALTLVAMSNLMGGTPTGCRSNLEGEVACVWYLDTRVYGHGTVLASLSARSGSKARLRCIFQMDGRPRGEDSCEASLDD